MSKVDIYRTEVARRRKSISDLEKGNVDTIAAIEQFNQLDESYKKEQLAFKEELDCIYLETRYYNGNWPVVYDFAQSDRYPYFNGDSDDDCNPYYKISLVIAGEEDGISPVLSDVDRTGGPEVNRYREHPNENTQRAAALTELENYPDTSDEVDNCGTDVDDGMGGTIHIPAYCPGDTGVEKLQAVLIPWRDNLINFKLDFCEGTTALEDKVQEIIDEINNCLSLLPSIPTYPTNTPNPGPALAASIAALIDFIENDMVTIFDTRRDDLNSRSELLEQKYFSIIGLRLHQVNGSYSKLLISKDQLETNKRVIEDHKKSIASINVLIVNEN